MVFSQHVLSEPFEPSPFMPAVTSRGFDNDFDTITSRQPRLRTDTSERLLQVEKEKLNEKENSGKESNLAKIKVVVCWSLLFIFVVISEVLSVSTSSSFVRYKFHAVF